jgi:Spy/CpxP family protein refolding chaperone
MIKTRLVFVVCFLMAFGAGISVGALWQKPEKMVQEGWLAELNLTPEQREKMKSIWTETMKNSGWQAQRGRREAAQKERDEAMKAIIPIDHAAMFDEIMSTYQKKMDEIAQESRKAKDEAYEKTKEILTEQQRVTYEELRKKRMESRNRKPQGSDGNVSGDAEKKPEHNQSGK